MLVLLETFDKLGLRVAVHRAFVVPDSLVLVLSPSERQCAEFLRKAAAFVRKLGLPVRGDGDNDVSVLL